jgi:RNA polymerase sigma-70 factor (ECF subfamily)
MDHDEWLAERFQHQRPQLRAVAYRMLGSLSEADDALQEAWLRIGRSDTSAVENLGGWFTTIVARVSLNMLRSRKAKREESLETRLPDPVISPHEGGDPEHEALTADAVGLAMLVVLETLAPAERLAFVLHDMFAVPFDEIASITDRSPAAARQLASRARRRVRDQAPVPDPDLARQREVVDAFAAAAQEGDFEGLVAVLDPDIVLRSDGGTKRPSESVVIRGARAVAERAFIFRRLSPWAQPVLVNGAVGAFVAPHGRPFAVMAFTVANGKIVEIDVLADPDRLTGLGAPALSG